MTPENEVPEGIRTAHFGDCDKQPAKNECNCNEHFHCRLHQQIEPDPSSPSEGRQEIERLTKALQCIRSLAQKGSALRMRDVIEGINLALEPAECYYCGTATDQACSDCRIDFSVTVFVCPNCRDKHEARCSKAVRDKLETAEQQLVEARALVAELAKAASNFGARVQERCPSWFKEEPGSTDFSEANARLAAAIERAADAQKEQTETQKGTTNSTF